MHKRFLCALLVCVCLLGVFSNGINVYASAFYNGEEYPLIEKNPYISTLESIDTENFRYWWLITENEGDTPVWIESTTQIPRRDNGYYRISAYIELPNYIQRTDTFDYVVQIALSSPISHKGLYYAIYNEYGNPIKQDVFASNDVITSSRIDFDVDNISPTSDVFAIAVGIIDPTFTSEYITMNIAEVRIDTVDESKGFFTRIIDAVTGIFDSIKELPTRIANSIKGFFDNVVNAVTNLGTTIINGIKSLFVPTQEELQVYFGKWEELLQARFGAIYECGEIVYGYVDMFRTYNQTDTIRMPEVSVPLAGEVFTFGGYDVDIVPDGFDFLADAVKLVIDIVCTIAFVDAMKRKYNKLVERG